MLRIFVAVCGVLAWTMGVSAEAPTTLNDFFLPGSQPGQSGNLEHPTKCDNCHGGYDQAVEPAYNWRGSMMAQAARDPLFYACMAIANQDAPDSGDLCIRCHSPDGWLAGRSVPTDGSALNNNDREGVQCDFCHKLVKPVALGENPYPDDAEYVSGGTFDQDQAYLANLAEIPPTSANGMYVADGNNAKRGPFVDAVARHQMLYSPFHPEAALCGTCHDVSNPAYSKQADGSYMPNAFDAPAPSFDLRDMFPVERTYSEWLMSAYNTAQGVFAPQFDANNPVSTCQDCHMRDVTGVGCNKRGAPVRTDLPLHDMTGGNTFIPKLIEAAFPGETDPAALQAGIRRATEMLQKAATLELSVADGPDGKEATVTVTNETGHKLPSGYPEGRRIWINLKAYDVNGDLAFQSGAYDAATATLETAGTKIYEIKPGISGALAPVVDRPQGVGFHFVLNNEIFKDNRIPPRGFTNANFLVIQSPPVDYTYGDGQYWDVTTFGLPTSAEYVVATLNYQTVSKEYVEFLREKNVTNDWGQRFYDLWAANGKSEPVVMAQASWGQIADAEAPTAPTNLTATAVSKSQIDLAWDPSTDNVGVAGYRVYRAPLQDPVGDVASESFSDTGLNPETTYTYAVVAYDASGNVSDASAASATTPAKKGGPRAKKPALWAQNPFNPATVIGYALPDDAELRIEVYDVTGQVVAVLFSGNQTAGHHSLRWTPSGLATGIYLIRLKAGPHEIIKKVSLLK